MNKGFLAMLVISISSHFAMAAAQTPPDSLSKFYFKASAGYGLGINGTLVENADKNGNVTNTFSKLGTGFGFSVAAGYQWLPHLGFEVGLGYFMGMQTNLLSSYDATETTNGSLFQMVPSIVFSTKLGRLQPYLKTGLIMALPEVYGEDIQYDRSNPNQTIVTDSKFKYYNGLALGVHTALGCNLPLMDNRFSLFAEVSLNDIGYVPDRIMIYAQTVNGVDDYSQMTTSDKEGIFRRTLSLNNSSNSDKPTDLSQTLIPFSSLAFNIGLKWNLGRLSLPISDARKEDPFYVRLQVGYGFAGNGDIYYDNQESAHDLQTTYFSGGTGLNIGLGVGYMLNENLGFDLGGNYALGAPLKTQMGVTMPNANPLIFPNEPITSLNGDMLQLNPAVVFATHIQQFKPYARLGMLIGSGEINSVYDFTLPNQFGGHYNDAYKFYGGVSLGYNAVLGIAYPIHKNIDVYADATFNNIYFSPTNGEIVSTHTYPSAGTSRETINFEYSYNNSAQQYNYGNGQTASPIVFSFNTIVASVGIRVWY